MSDYVAKPFTRSQIEAVLSAWVSPGREKPDGATTAEPHAES